MSAHHDEHASDHEHEHEHHHSRGVRGLLQRLVHSHDHADSVDTALESSAAGIRAVKVSLVVLGLTAALQLVVVLLSGSVALLADTVHNFSDALTALPLWCAFVLARRTPTRRYTYGYGRAEDLAGVFVVTMIALSAVVAGVESVRRLLDPQPLDHALAVLVAGVLGFAGNEAVAVYRIRVGRRIGSAALAADGAHARTDGFTSLAVAVGAVGAMLGFPLADPLVGLLITVAILVVLRGAVRDVYGRLMDAVDPGLVDRAEHVLGRVPGVLGVEGIRMRWVGHRIHADAGLVVDHDLSVWDGHAVAVDAEHALLHGVPRLDVATVHVSPSPRDGEDPHAALAHHQEHRRPPISS